MDFPQNKIYYKGNPHTRQNYIPNSAQKNRMKSHFLVQFPQGNQYFETSRKKQYASKHNQSQIKNTGIFPQQPSTYNHGTLYVSDIEGAIPNTLVAQAIKNRLKGQILQNSRNSRASQDSNYSEIDQANQYFRQKQQLKKKNNSIVNYHLIKDKNRVQTQPTYQHNNNSYLSHPHSPPHSPYSPHYHHSPHNHIHQQLDFKINPQYRYVPQTTQTDNMDNMDNMKINQLEQRLFARQHNKLKPSVDDYRTNARPSIQDYRTNNNNNNNINGQQKYLPVAQSAKKLEIQQSPTPPQQSKNSNNTRGNNIRSVQEIKQMWHGDHHKLRLFPAKEIRKFSPTYLSTENILHSQDNYSKYILPKIK